MYRMKMKIVLRIKAWVYFTEDSRVEEKDEEEGLEGVVAKLFVIIVEKHAILCVTVKTQCIPSASIANNFLML